MRQIAGQHIGLAEISQPIDQLLRERSQEHISRAHFRAFADKGVFGYLSPIPAIFEP
jgi:hypothetical protein